MNVNIVRLKGVEKQLARIADALESYLAYNDVPIKKRLENPKSEENMTQVLYTDEVADAIREYKEMAGMVAREEEPEG